MQLEPHLLVIIVEFLSCAECNYNRIPYNVSFADLFFCFFFDQLENIAGKFFIILRPELLAWKVVNVEATRLLLEVYDSNLEFSKISDYRWFRY